MRLTLHTDYALRALMYLALKGDAPASIREIAGAYGISENHMVKVVHGLGRAGFVQTTRGRGGGLRLGRPANEIVVGDVVRHTEEDLALVPCFPGREGCVIAGPCGLERLLADALARFMAVLDAASLADLVAPARAEIAARLGLLPPAGGVRSPADV
jgi:Rrf2 family transcriptional regulator, nitric oxide-sensitive transcriptional repressor